VDRARSILLEGTPLCRLRLRHRSQTPTGDDLWGSGWTGSGRGRSHIAPRAVDLAPFTNMEVREQSIYEIAEADTFDIAFSIGVVHHLSDPDAAVARLTRAVKPGGQVLLWLYGRENKRLDRACVQPVPPRAVQPHARCDWFTPCPWPLTALLWCALRVGFPPGAYYRLIRRFSFEHLRAIVFDHMIPRNRAVLYAGGSRGIAGTGGFGRCALHLGQ